MQKAHHAAPGDEPEPHTQEARCWRRTIHPYRVSSSTSRCLSSRAANRTPAKCTPGCTGVPTGRRPEKTWWRLERMGTLSSCSSLDSQHGSRQLRRPWGKMAALSVALQPTWGRPRNKPDCGATRLWPCGKREPRRGVRALRGSLCALPLWQRHGEVLMKIRRWFRIPKWLRERRWLREPVEEDIRSSARRLGVAAAAGMFGVFVYAAASPLAIMPLHFGIVLLYYGSTKAREGE